VAETVRVRLYWDDGTIETARAPIDAEARIIVRTAKDGSHRHFEVTDDLDAEGYRIAIKVLDEPPAS
jgi:hypothetical protein